MEEITVIAELGLPIAGALGMGYFVFLMLQFILQGVMSEIEQLGNIITNLDNRVRMMNHEVMRIDVIISQYIGLRPDIRRLARSDGRNDVRKD